MKNPKTQKDVQAQMSDFLPVSSYDEIWNKNFLPILVKFVKTKSEDYIFFLFTIACIRRSGKNERTNVLS